MRRNWFKEIVDLGLERDFDLFVQDNNLKQHLEGRKELSKNRLARAYVLKTENIIKNVNLWR